MYLKNEEINHYLYHALEDIKSFYDGEEWGVTKETAKRMYEIADRALKIIKTKSNKTFCEFCTDDGCNVCKIYEDAPHQYE